MFFVGTPSTMNFNTQLNIKKPISIIYMYSKKKPKSCHHKLEKNKVILSFNYTVWNSMCNKYSKISFYYKTQDIKVNFVQIFLYIFRYDESR